MKRVQLRIEIVDDTGLHSLGWKKDFYLGSIERFMLKPVLKEMRDRVMEIQKEEEK